MSGANPWEVLALRKKIKQFSSIGLPEAMKALHKLRSLGLDRQILITTEVTRTLVWACNKTKENAENEEKRKFHVMLRFLLKEFRKKLGVDKKQ